MIIKINFTQPEQIVPVANQKELNSYIHKCVGKNNKFHDAFSNYCVSSLQGGKLNIEDNTLVFNEIPHIFVTTNNEKFTESFLNGVMQDKHTLFGMHYKNIEMLNFNINRDYDLIYMASPILLKRNNIKISYKDSNYIEALRDNCIAKLKYEGIEDETFDIELHNVEKSKVKKIMVGDVFNIATIASFIVRGKRETREKLYNLGLGNSTGSGFGMVKPL